MNNTKNLRYPHPLLEPPKEAFTILLPHEKLSVLDFLAFKLPTQTRCTHTNCGTTTTMETLCKYDDSCTLLEKEKEIKMTVFKLDQTTRIANLWHLSDELPSDPSPQAEPEKTQKRDCPPKEQPEKALLAIYPQDEMKKPDKRRKDVAALLKIAQGLDWDEVKVKITEKLAERLKLKKPDLSDYKLTFSVPQHQTSPIPLVNEDDFDNLCEVAIKCKDPQAKVIIEAILKKASDERIYAVLDDNTLIKKGTGKENNVGSDNEDDGTDDDSANRPKKKRKARTGEESTPVTVKQPPNHRAFDGLHDNQMAVKSPLLQQHLSDRDKNTSSAPTINFNIPPELLGFLRPPAPENAANMVALPHRDQRTHTIKYIVVSELKEMGFMNGKIAAMKDAVEQWSRQGTLRPLSSPPNIAVTTALQHVTDDITGT
ncbi:uncharacterized protein EDB91DRAFT_1084791 [Suillus paluster]|uniref:uncharacterized protein n=1 Tax=Suillus paluster TaxID=48578 RepID=UPI001B85E122|nr:uncharacterized protein EDB91DRAFT_1084791 [Suillus paluster]KAG1732463.1 hypothetical protein EDB91DRAFT_1084791 [Suillus paluster]